MIAKPLNWSSPWPYPWSRLEELAQEAGLEAEELRAYLEAEVARRRQARDPEQPQALSATPGG